MVADAPGVAFVVVALFVLAGLAAGSRRGTVPRDRLLLFAGVCLTWLANGLVQVSQDGPVRAGTPSDSALDALAVVVLTAGVVLLYRWVRDRDAGPDGS